MRVLYSPSYGSGWSTSWHGDEDERVFFLTHQPTVDALVRDEKLGLPHFMRFARHFFLSFPDYDEDELVTDWWLSLYKGLQVSREIASGAYWRLNEHDGSESVEIFDPSRWERCP